MTDYTFVARLGEGAMGVVFLARHTASGREVALKLLHRRLAGDAELHRRFRREIATVSRLSHPAIIKVYDAGEEQGVPYYTMEYLEGAQPLSAVLEDHGVLELETAVDAMRALLDALVYCHGEGVLHRDLKPGNIMFGPGERVTVMDFGLARHLEASLLTAPGTLLGTPRYLAPEAISGELVAPSADLWSAGAIFYEMLAGRPAFGGSSVNDVLGNIMKREPPPPSQVNAALPGSLDPLVMRFLAKDPAARHASASEALAALDAWTRNQGVRAPENVTVGLRRPLAKKARVRPRTSVAQAVALAVAMLSVTAMGLGLARRAGPSGGRIPTPVTSAPEPGPVPPARAGADLRSRLAALDPLRHLRWIASELSAHAGANAWGRALPPDVHAAWTARISRALSESGAREASALWVPVRDAYYADASVAPEEKRSLYELVQETIELADSLTVLRVPFGLDAHLFEATGYGPAREPIERPLPGVGFQLRGCDANIHELLRAAPGSTLDPGTRRGRMRVMFDLRFASPAERSMMELGKPAYVHDRLLTLPPGAGPVEARLCVDKFTAPTGLRLLYAAPQEVPMWKPFLFVRTQRGTHRHLQRHRIPDGVLPATPFLVRAEVAYVAARAFTCDDTEQDATLFGLLLGRP